MNVCEASRGIDCHTWQLQGDPTTLLVREAQRADLLVMGRSFVPYEFGQSPTNILQEVLRHTSRPVLCAPAPAEENAVALVAYDGSAPAAKALQAFENLGLAAGRLVHLHAGVIVMGAFGQSRIREFFFGSLTKTVLRDSKVPLFLYH